MMKMLKCYSRFYSLRSFLFCLLIVSIFNVFSEFSFSNSIEEGSSESKIFLYGTRLAHLGSVAELTDKMIQSKEVTWFGSEVSEPVLLNVRLEWVDIPLAGVTPVERVNAWVQSLQKLSYGEKILKTPTFPSNEWLVSAMKTVQSNWEPMSSSDVKVIRECSDIPCDIKLNDSEVRALKQVGPEFRLSKFYDQIKARLSAYVQADVRSSYEFPGSIIDPWKWFNEQGFRVVAKNFNETDTWVRMLNLDPNQMRPVRQILDRRFYVSHLSGRQIEASVWIRDVYTAHYFDSWGEVYWIRYFPDIQKLLIIMAHAVELDFYKQSDLITVLARPRMKTAFFKESTRYLNEQATKLRNFSDAK